MPRKTVGSPNKRNKNAEAQDESFDYSHLVNSGVTLLKFGRSGKPHERVFRLSHDHRFLKWNSGIFTFMQKDNLSKICDRLVYCTALRFVLIFAVFLSMKDLITNLYDTNECCCCCCCCVLNLVRL